MIHHIDHIVLTVSDIEKSVDFYKRVCAWKK
ncbi:VOC family protein [Vibrio parahaemolyticus]